MDTLMSHSSVPWGWPKHNLPHKADDSPLSWNTSGSGTRAATVPFLRPLHLSQPPSPPKKKQ